MIASLGKLALVGGLAALSGLLVPTPITALAHPDSHHGAINHLHSRRHSAFVKRMRSDPDASPSLTKRRRVRRRRSKVKRDSVEAEMARRDGRLKQRDDGTACIVRDSGATSTVWPAASSAYTTPWSSVYTAPSWAYSSSASAPSASSSSTTAVTVAAAVVTGSTTSGSTAPSKGNGLGLAWANGDYASSGDPNYVGNYIGGKVGWYYTWSAYNVPSADSLGLEFVPMLWGGDDSYTSAWTSQQSSWPSDTKYVMFLNEPEISSQSNIAAADAVSLWQTYMSPLKQQGYKLGAAATTSSSLGLDWLNAFNAACPECASEIDFIPVHWYDVTTTNFQSFLNGVHQNISSLEIWVTEYACQSFTDAPQCDSGETWSLHQSMTPWFEQSGFITRFAPFGFMENMQGVNDDNALMDNSGAITDLGNWYIYNS